jgi:hypothetical protein
MKRVCPKCHYIGTGRHKGSLLGGGVLLGCAIILFGLIYQESLGIAILVLMTILFVSPISIRNYYRIGKICPICRHKRMPAINEPRGQEIINKNGLKIEYTATYACNNCNTEFKEEVHHLGGYSRWLWERNTIN